MGSVEFRCQDALEADVSQAGVGGLLFDMAVAVMWVYVFVGRRGIGCSSRSMIRHDLNHYI